MTAMRLTASATGAAISRLCWRSSCGPPGAIVGGVIGAVVDEPEIHCYHHHRIYIDGDRHYYNENGRRHYY